MSERAGAQRRFAAPAASPRSQHLIGAAIVASVALVGVGGLATGIEALTFFAVGAGAGYSLSGSV